MRDDPDLNDGSEEVFCTTSSTNVFHSLQDGHLPTHLGLCVPQFWQKNAVLILLIVSLLERAKYEV
jgi:hypothetical protein